MKRIISLLLSLILIFSALPLSALKTGASPFMGGDGSEANPYLVSTPEALDAVRDYPDSHFRQTCNINILQSGNWNPIKSFSGIYDGGGYSIIGLTIIENSVPNPDDGRWEYYGLFADASGATLKNINLSDIFIDITKDFSQLPQENKYNNCFLAVGGLCAIVDSKEAFVDGCRVSGKIRLNNVTEAYVGGLIGSVTGDNLYNSSENTKVTNCINETVINVETIEEEYYDFSRYTGPYIFAGGIVGWFGGSYIHTNANLGDITVISYRDGSAGGICGASWNEKTYLYSCLNTGNISYIARFYTEQRTSKSGVGGIAGSTNCSIQTSVNYGDIYSESLIEYRAPVDAGGLVGTDKHWNHCERVSVSGVNIGGFITAKGVYADQDYYWDSLAGRIASSAGSISGYSYDGTSVNGKLITESSKRDKNGENLTREQLLSTESYAGLGLGFQEWYGTPQIWQIDEAAGGPMLCILYSNNTPDSPSDDTTNTDPENTPELGELLFNEITYRADHLTDGQDSILSNLEAHNYLLTNTYSPSKIIIQSHKEGMDTAASAWEAMKIAIEVAEGKASAALDYNIKQEELISSYILGAVGAYSEIRYVDIVKDNYKHVNNLLKISSELNGTFAASGQDFKTFAKGKEGELEKLLKQYYDENDPTMSKLLKSKQGASVISSIISKASSFEDLYQMLAAYSKLYTLNDSIKEALDLMYEVCPAEAKDFKEPLKFASEIINAANEDMVNDIISHKMLVGTTIETSYILVDKMWGYITESFCQKCPTAQAYIALAKTQMTIVDKVFGIDAKLEQYFKLCVISQLDGIAGIAVNQALLNYKEHRTVENAEIFLASIELKFSFIDIDFQESIKYSEVITDSGYIQKAENLLAEIIGITQDNNLKDALIRANKSKDYLHCTIATSWITELDRENHDLAKNYYKYRNQMYTLYLPEEAEELVAAFERAARLAQIHCPVNVSVYNSAGELVAEVGEDMVWSSGAIAVVYDHGQKDIYFFDNGDYRIVCEGYAEGDMDVSFIDYDSDGNVTRTLNYNNVPVSAGTIHTLYEETVTDGDGTSLEADYDSSAGTEKHKVTVSYGVINGYHTEYNAAKGERVEISAIIPEGYRFVGWIGEVKFEDAKSASTYFFMPDGDVTVSAKLKKIENEDDEDAQKNSGTLRIVIIICAVGAGIVILCITAILIITVKKHKEKDSKEKAQ